MKLVLGVLSLAALAAAQSSSEPQSTSGPQSSTGRPDHKCECALGTHEEPHHHDNTILYSFHNLWDKSCDEEAHRLCQEECHTHLDQIEVNGGWDSTPIGHDGGNTTIGDAACEALGKDERHEGIETHMYFAVCGHELREGGPGLREHLCCMDGAYMKCHGPPSLLGSIY